MSEQDRHQYTWSDGKSIHGTVVAAVSELTGTPETELPPLQDAVDVDAMESLLHHGRDDSGGGVTTVSFTYLEYRIAVRSDGTITIRRRERRRP